MSPDRLRLVSLNTWKNDGDLAARSPRMVEALRELAPDVLCLQEAFAAPSLGVDLAAEVAAALGLAPSVLVQRVKERTHRGVPVLSSSNLVIAAAAAPPFQRVELPMAVEDGERCGQIARLGNGLTLLHLHLTHLRGAAGAELRGRQIAAALGAAGPCDDLLVVGDLNAPADAPELAPLFGAPIDRGPDLAAADAPTMRDGRAAIDHVVLLRPRVWRIARSGRALDAARDGVFPSDHLAVTADLEKRA